MEQLIDFHAPEVQAVLDTLLKDKSTGKNIIWATDPPEELQTVMYEPVTDRSQITTQQLGLTHYEVVLPRMMKQTDTQQQRTRKKGEVFSPAWVCNKMNNALDADWFRGLGAEESAGQFTVELPQGWQTVETPVQFPACGGRTPAWVQYVQNRRLEVTCGEAPFLASRYDAATGEMIPVARRIGILDRKLRVVSENAATEDEWRKYATHAVQSTYGYEYPVASEIVKKVKEDGELTLDKVVSSRKPFGLATTAKPMKTGDITLRYNGGRGPYKSTEIRVGTEMIDQWKIIISRLTAEHAGQPAKDGKYRVLSTMELLKPGEICSETYLVAGAFDSKEEATNYMDYLKTQFVRFLILQIAMTQQLSKASFAFVPCQDFTRKWTDKQLFEKYDLSGEEVNYIQGMIKEMA